MKVFVSNVKVAIACLVIIVLLPACNLEFLQGLKALNDKYCAETNAEKRAKIIEAIRKKKPDYPDGGLCGIEERIMDRIA